MEITLTFTPEEFKEHQALIEKGKAYDKVLKQRDEATEKFVELQNAIEDAGFGITVSCGGNRPDKYSIHEMDAETKEWYKKYPHGNGHLRAYTEED